MSELIIDCFTAFQQQRLLAPTLGVGSFRSYQDTQGPVDRQKYKKKITVEHNSVTQHTLLVVPMCPNQIEGYTSVYCQHARVYLKINTKTTLARLHDENTHANCLPTSLLDHSVKQQVLVICLVLG